MKPETKVYVDIARRHLDDAVKIDAAGLFRVAAREPYAAALNAARALIFEARDRTSKTHSGTRTLMHELIPEWPSITRDAVEVLTTGFDQKMIADYGPVGAPESITPDEAHATLTAARTLLGQIEAALASRKDE